MSKWWRSGRRHQLQKVITSFSVENLISWHASMLAWCNRSILTECYCFTCRERSFSWHWRHTAVHCPIIFHQICAVTWIMMLFRRDVSFFQSVLELAVHSCQQSHNPVHLWLARLPSPRSDAQKHKLRKGCCLLLAWFFCFSVARLSVCWFVGLWLWACRYRLVGRSTTLFQTEGSIG